MNKSEQINELAAALSKAQQEIRPAHKDAKNPFFNSKYADLTTIWESCREALNKNGLSIVQTLGDGALHTTLLHSSGQWISGSCPLINKKEDMQGLGSAISYARRYSVAAICGVVTEDDDANTADRKGDLKSPGDNKPMSSIPPSSEKITEKQQKLVSFKLGAKGYLGVDQKTFIMNQGHHFIHDIPYNKMNEILDAIEKLPSKKKPAPTPTVDEDIPWPETHR